MQTNFTLAQLADPDMAASEQILRTCVHCGFCTATCPTYRAARRRAGQPTRPHLPDQGHAGERQAGEAHEVDQAYRPLPHLSFLHDHLPVGRALYASGRPGQDPYRENLQAPAGTIAAAALAARQVMVPYARPLPTGECWVPVSASSFARFFEGPPRPAGPDRRHVEAGAFDDPLAQSWVDRPQSVLPAEGELARPVSHS